MRNLTLTKLVFALLLVGKVGKLGELSTISWYWVIAPLLLNYLFAFFAWVWKIGNFQHKLTEEVKIMQAKRLLNKNEKVYNEAVKQFKKELKDGSN